MALASLLHETDYPTRKNTPTCTSTFKTCATSFTQFLGAGVFLISVAVTLDVTAAPLFSASGLDGAGLGLLEEQHGRAWGELAYHKQSNLTIVSPTFGIGFIPISQLELGLTIPISRVVSVNPDIAETQLGNLRFSASLLSLSGEPRATVGLGLALPTAPAGDSTAIATNQVALAPHGYQHMTLRMPQYSGIDLPLHVETGKTIIGSLDASVQVLLPTSKNPSRDAIGAMTFSPGFGGYATDHLILGLRLPMWFFLTGKDSESKDRAQLTFEPFIRLNLGTYGFISTRVTIPMDRPLTEAKMWGFHLGGGGAF